MSEEYLWDKSGVPDPEVVHLEEQLAEFSLKAPPPALPAVDPRPQRMYLIAALVLASVGVVAFLLSTDRSGSTPTPTPLAQGEWDYELLTEVATDGGPPKVTARSLKVGGWIDTSGATRARLVVADIGELELAPGSRLQLLATGSDQHRVRLERGRMHAKVNAPPRLFVTETPAGDAVDLGCEYTLEVQPDGNGILEVALGMVMFERGGYDAFVPAGARCVAKREQGMGTPYFTDASKILRLSLLKLDFETPGETTLADVLEECKARDTLTLWNLLQHPRLDSVMRGRVLDRIEDFIETIPAELNRSDLVGGNAQSLRRLRDVLWMRFW